MLSLGKGTRQHALIAGKTGSGKSTLFHVIITNLSLWCSPEQVEFYLVDFKKGVEFKCYADRKLPHAKVIAIESDRQFALSVLQRVDAELKNRGEIFRKAGSQDLASYNRNSGQRPPGPGLRHPRHPRLADAGRCLHAGARHAGPDGRAHRPAVQ
jgi:DNA segregation ATPase FtsK/SpoIIIE-like protein